MDDTELYREQILRHYGPVITGRFLGYRDSYTREVKVGQPLLIVLYMTASVITMLLSLIRSGSSRRSFKDLKKGPEYLVTLIRLRDDLGQIYEVEMHGNLPQSALHRGDLVQLRVVEQKDPDLPVRLHQVINLETLQPFRPWVPTMWSHLGPALLVQAALGTVVTLAVVTAWIS
ncbi:hypothetical protein [Actinoplanes sp. N902-109]|uniref:hypothetical protein n=1 Tax=Actinoplanes sp. (strain N902-109) TaxID=649831 RepID=UPI000329476C|nr:hypothetical protein [Actinoplanes sp. N902-109]AGL18673.1 hypothetical protein L083_5163 [Actinoplanes sp. N902-109]